MKGFMEDFLLFIVGVFVLLIIVSTIFGQGIAYNILWFVAGAEPSYLQEELITTITSMAYSPGEAEERLRIDFKRLITINDDPYPSLLVEAPEMFSFSKSPVNPRAFLLGDCELVKECVKTCGFIGDQCGSDKDCCTDLRCEAEICKSRTCNNGAVDDYEDCDTAADDNCPGLCQKNCTCPPTKQCSDGDDNDGDGSIDDYDPECHTDCDASNADSYNPDDTNEARVAGDCCKANDDCGGTLLCLNQVRVGNFGDEIIIQKYFEDNVCKIKVSSTSTAGGSFGFSAFYSQQTESSETGPTPMTGDETSCENVCKTRFGDSFTGVCRTPVEGSTCSCSSTWTPGLCGGGPCSSTQRQYTRTCTPTGCTASDGYSTFKCIADALCSGGTGGTPSDQPYLGFSGYVTSTTEIDKIIDVMEENNMNIFRLSFNPEWYGEIQKISSNAAGGQKIVNVIDASDISKLLQDNNYNPINTYIIDDNSNFERNQIVSVNGNSLTMKNSLSRTYTTINNARVDTRTHPYLPIFIKHFVDNSDFTIIVDRNHIYPPTVEGANTYVANKNIALQSMKEVAQNFPSSRVWIEITNEYARNDFYTMMEEMVAGFRAANYDHTLIADRFWMHTYEEIEDEDKNTWGGIHVYFNDDSVSNAMSKVKKFTDIGVKIVNTEVGASYNEYGDFDEDNVKELSDFLKQTYDLSESSSDIEVGNCIWMNENLRNWQTYKDLGLVIPSATENTNPATGYMLSTSPTATYQVTVNPNNEIRDNKLSLGTQITFDRLLSFPNSPEMQKLLKDANFKMVRMFATWSGIRPCDSWNEATKNCNNWDWSGVDAFVESVYNSGAEPLINLAHCCNSNQELTTLPGMSTNPATGLPYPDQFAAYTRAWVKHFKEKNYPIRFYEVVNEVQFYLITPGGGWGSITTEKIDNYMELHRAASNAMRQENSNIIIGFDFDTQKTVLDRWLFTNGPELDSLNFHKYDSYDLNQYTDQQLFDKAESQYFGTWPLGRSVMESQTLYNEEKGFAPYLINSESNMNSFTTTGTDERLVQMSGAVWTALVLRQDILNGIDYNIYFTWASNQNYEQNPTYKPDGGYGFGLINDVNNQPRYPYYVHKMIGPNLDVGDSVVESSSNSGDIRTLSWVNNGKLNILLIHKGTGTKTFSLHGMIGTFSYQKIEDLTGQDFLNPSIKPGTVNTGSVITLNGYTVMLLQQTSTTPQPTPSTQEPASSGSCLQGEYKMAASCGTGICCCHSDTWIEPPSASCDQTCKNKRYLEGGICAAGGTLVGENLADVPNDWGDYDTYGRIVYGADPQIAFVDNDVLFNGKTSIRIEKHVEGVDINKYREVDGNFLTFSPGDHVYFSCWIKTNPDSPNPGRGGIIGVDLYGPSGRLWEVCPLVVGSKENYVAKIYDYRYVPYNSDWTLLAYDFIVTDHMFTATDLGAAVPAQQTNGGIPWVTIDWNKDVGTNDATAWFSDCELYINPSSTGGEGTSGENLAVIPDDWGTTYGTGPQIISVVQFDGKECITIAPHVDGVDKNTDRECDGTWYAVKPGDRIVASVWIYVGDSGHVPPSTDPYTGGRLGMDLYAHTSEGYGIVYSRPDWGTEHSDSMVPWKTNAWVKKTWDFIVPDTYYTELKRASWEPCDPVQIDSFVLWLDVRDYTDPGQVYFSDGELYIYQGELPAVSSGEHKLFVGTIGSGTVSPSVGAYSYSAGSTVTLTATPAPGCTFSHWLLNAAFNKQSSDPYSHVLSSYDSFTITMDSDKYVTAVFMGSPIEPGGTTQPACTGTPFALSSCPSGTCCCSGTLTQTCDSECKNQFDPSSTGTCLTGGTPDSPQTKILRQTFQNWRFSASKFASNIDVYQAHYNALDVFPQIKEIRPEVLGFVYYNAIHVWKPGSTEYEADKLQTFIDNNWIMKDTNGNYVEAYNGYAYYVDFGNPNYHQWLANWFKKYIDLYDLDGASLDNWFCEKSVWYYVENGATAINPRTGSPWTDQEICNAFKSLTIKIKQVIGQDKIMLANGVYNGNHFFMPSRNPFYIDGLQNGGVDAIMSEAWVSSYDTSNWYTEEVWKKGIDFAVWLEKNWDRGKYFMQISGDSSWTSGSYTGYPSDMTQQQYEQYFNYAYASRLLSVERLTSIAWFGYYIYEPYPQSLFEIDVGVPSGDYYMVSGTHVYAREFTEAKVLVNPTYSSYTVDIGIGYKDMNDQPVSSSITVQPHTGVILLKQQSTSQIGSFDTSSIIWEDVFDTEPLCVDTDPWPLNQDNLEHYGCPHRNLVGQVTQQGGGYLPELVEAQGRKCLKCSAKAPADWRTNGRSQVALRLDEDSYLGRQGYGSLTKIWERKDIWLPLDYNLGARPHDPDENVNAGWDMFSDYYIVDPVSSLSGNAGALYIVMRNGQPHLRFSSEGEESIISEKPLPKGQWLTIKHYRTIHPTNGIFKAWVNGELWIDFVGNTAVFKYHDNGAKFTDGSYYTGLTCKSYIGEDELYTVTKYIDNWVVSTEDIPDDYVVGEPYSGGGTQPTCSGTSIGQDGCDSGICCCSETSGQCTPGNDMIQGTDYPSGSCSSTSILKWSHSNCGNGVCKQGFCKEVDADLSYTAPSSKIARSDYVTIPYTIKNTGETQWCFLTESSLRKPDGNVIWINERNTVLTSASDSLSYQIECSDPIGQWTGNLYTTTDLYRNSGWDVWGPIYHSFQVVECLNNQDCVNCRGSSYTCDTTSNTCKYGIKPPPNNGDFDTDSIIWQYGAETKSLEEAFPEQVYPNDWLGLKTSVTPYTVDGVSYTYNIPRASIVSSPKISGNRVVQSYLPPPPKDYEHKYGTLQKDEKSIQVTELYYSSKLIFSELSLEPSNDWGPNLCDWQIWWGPPLKPFAWWIGSRFSVTSTTKRLGVSLSAGKLPDRPWFNTEPVNQLQMNVFGANPRYDGHQTWYPTQFYDLHELGAGNVVRLMGYIKLDGADCYTKAWVNDELIMDLGPFAFDPREYPEWYNDPIYGETCVFSGGLGKPVPTVSWGIYQGELSFENKVWYDDMVIATEYIPMSYEVTVDSK